jgi:pimeloyl-ACP methyl ester carboxylesterase
MLSVVLAPGLLCDGRLWSGVRGHLQRPVVELDFSRHDRLESMAANILESAPERFVLAGFSMGGMAAVLAAAEAPERVAALVLIDTHAEPETPSRKAVRARQLESVADGRFQSLVMEQLKPAYFSPAAERRSERALVAAMALELGPRVFRRHVLALMSRPDPSPLLARLTMPTVVMTGRDDALVPPTFADNLARAAPNARLVVLEDCGHMAPLEQPARVAAEIEAVTRAAEESAHVPAE